MRIRPKILLDIKHKKFRGDIFAGINERVNLSYRKRHFIPWNAILLGSFVLFLGIFTLWGNPANAPIKTSGLLAQSLGITDEREALEAELEELERQIAEHEQTISSYKNQGVTLKSEIDALNAKVNKINLQIRAINLSLDKLDTQISNTAESIEVTEQDIELRKKTLSIALQALYESDQKALIEIFLEHSTLSGFFDSLNGLLAVQESLRFSLEELSVLYTDLLDKKELLSLERSDAAALKAYQDGQRRNVQNIKTEKDGLLAITKGKESEYQKLLVETKKSAAQIRNRLFELIGGGALNFESAYNLAKMAEGATGVRAALILAVLDRESALGRNVGQCDYLGAMHPTRDVPVFLAIVNELRLNGDLERGILKVSCPISSDGAYGGAMGPAQFIPSTWAIYGGYAGTSGAWRYEATRDSIGRITGSNPSSPWRNPDAFVATGLYLSDAYNSSGCRDYAEQYKHLVPKQTLQERCAAAKYYAGSRWFTYRFAYGDPVVERANKFEKDIEVILASR